MDKVIVVMVMVMVMVMINVMMMVVVMMMVMMVDDRGSDQTSCKKMGNVWGIEGMLDGRVYFRWDRGRFCKAGKCALIEEPWGICSSVTEERKPEKMPPGSFSCVVYCILAPCAMDLIIAPGTSLVCLVLSLS